MIKCLHQRLSETRPYGYSRPFRNWFIRLLATFQKLVHMATRDLSETRSYGYSRPFRDSFIWLLATFQKLVHVATCDLSETRSNGCSRPFRNSDDVKARAASRIIGIIGKVKKFKKSYALQQKVGSDLILQALNYS
jgi:hypothetical protein